jgi:hypothetical protein
MGKTKTPTPNDQKSRVKNPKDEWFEEDVKNRLKQKLEQPKKKS